MTPSQELVEQIRPRLCAAVEANTGRLWRGMAMKLAPSVALWAIELALSLLTPIIVDAIHHGIAAIRPFADADVVRLLDLIDRLLSQPKSTFDLPIQSALSASPES